MKLKVTEQGVFIPKELLGDSQEVEVIQEAEKIIITPQKKPSSIWELGQNPIECDVTDAARNHDDYLIPSMKPIYFLKDFIALFLVLCFDYNYKIFMVKQSLKYEL